MGAIILKGPLTLQDVATLVERASDAYYKRESSNGTRIKLGEGCMSDSVVCHQYPEYSSLIYRKEDFEARKKEYKAVVDGILIIDKTRLEDIANGQTIPPPISEFYIDVSTITAQGQYIVKILNEAQERINARLAMQGAVIRIEIK